MQLAVKPASSLPRTARRWAMDKKRRFAGPNRLVRVLENLRQAGSAVLLARQTSARKAAGPGMERATGPFCRATRPTAVRTTRALNGERPSGAQLGDRFGQPGRLPRPTASFRPDVHSWSKAPSGQLLPRHSPAPLTSTPARLTLAPDFLTSAPGRLPVTPTTLPATPPRLAAPRKARPESPNHRNGPTGNLSRSPPHLAGPHSRLIPPRARQPEALANCHLRREQ